MGTSTTVSVTSITSHGGRIIGNTHNGQTELYTLDTHWIEKIIPEFSAKCKLQQHSVQSIIPFPLTKVILSLINYPLNVYIVSLNLPLCKTK